MAIQQIQHGHGATIYPSDTENISEYLQVYGRSTCLYVGTGGNLRVLTVGGDDVTFRNVQSGQFIPVMVTKVFLTGTTASNITVVDMGPGRFRGLLFDYSKRVSFDGGVVEAGACVDAVNNLLLNASLLLIPSGYKGGKLYSEIPTNGNGDLTWTRGGDAFRTNASGLLQRVPWNLLQYSQEFDNAIWLKSSATITANSTTAPDGNTTADKIVGAGNNPLIYQSTSTLTGKYTFSIYGKKGELSWLRLTNSSAGTNAVWFDLNNGAVGTLVGAGNTANITSVGNGWYRCEFIINSFDSSQLTDLVIACTNADNTTTGYTGNSVDGLFIWGAQLVEGTTAQTYLPTTDRLNFPRLSYMYGSCPSALLEPQRTNLVLRSEEFDNASWVKQNASITANTTTSPDGSTNADSLIENTTLGQHFTYQQLTKSASSITYAFSVYYKNASGTRNLALGITNGTSSGKGAIFTTSGTITATNATIGSGVGFTFVSADVQSVGNGFYRATIVVTTDTATRVDAVAYLSDSTTSISNYTGNGTSALFIYGAQLEQGAYPTTYIPTSATATRVADSFSRNNIYTNGLISASGGTWFFELKNNVVYTRDNTQGMFIGDGTTSNAGNQIIIRATSGGRLALFKCIAGVPTQIYGTASDNLKLSIKWNGTSADVFANGTKVVSATSFTTTNMENLIGAVGTPLFIQQMALFPTPLSDTDCQLLTAL